MLPSGFAFLTPRRVRGKRWPSWGSPIGSTGIDGHVDSAQLGLGAFYRLEGPAVATPPGARPSRVTRSEADWMGLDIVRVRDLAARLEARLLSTPLDVFAPAAAELMRDALARLSPVLRALDGVIITVTQPSEAA